MALLDNLISYWKLDQASGNAADSAGSNTLTNNNTATYSAGKINNAANLVRASAQYFSITDGSQTGLDLSSDCTFAGWLNFASLPDASYDRAILSKADAANAERAYMLLATYNSAGNIRIRFGVSSSAGNFYAENSNANIPVSTSIWYHVVIVYTAASHSFQTYINGSASGTPVDIVRTSILNSSQPFILGRKWSTDADNNFDGSLDEWGIWARALSAADVTSLYNSGLGLSYPFTIPVPSSAAILTALI